MAYVSQELKAKLAPTLKAICKKYKMKATISVSNHSTLCLNIKSGPLDLIGNYNKVCGSKPHDIPFYAVKDDFRVNEYWYNEHFDGRALKFLDEIVPAMKGPDYFNDSDSMTDYFHCSHYITINVGQWDKPYILTK